MDETERRPRAPGALREEAVAWLARLRADPSAQDCVDFERWYLADPAHADTYDSLLEGWDAMGLARHTPAGRARTVGDPHRSRRSLVAIAATLLLLVLAGSLVFRNGLPGDAPPMRMATQVGEMRTVTLDDGSRLTLDTDSIVEVTFAGDERRLRLLQGRARFDVAHDAQRPFTVEAGSREVIAHGTLFDVDLQRQRLIVSLIEGSVEVRRPPASGAAPEASARLRPGERLALGPEAPAGPTTLRQADIGWPTGMLSFEDAPLSEVAAAANRYNRVQIILAGEGLAARRFTGTFRANDPQRLAEMIAAMFDLRLEHDRDRHLRLTSENNFPG